MYLLTLTRVVYDVGSDNRTGQGGLGRCDIAHHKLHVKASHAALALLLVAVHRVKVDDRVLRFVGPAVSCSPCSPCSPWTPCTGGSGGSGGGCTRLGQVARLVAMRVPVRSKR